MSVTLSIPDIDEPAPVRSAGTLRIASVLAALRGGEQIILAAEDACSLVLWGPTVVTASMARLIREGTGLVFVALPRRRLAELAIPRMHCDHESRCSELHVAVDACVGIRTGISATDRAGTVRLLSDSASGPGDFVRPGHVIPVAGDLSHTRMPGVPQLALALVSLVDHSGPSAAYSALTSRIDPCMIAEPAEGAQIAAEIGAPFVSRDDVLAAFYRGKAG